MDQQEQEKAPSRRGGRRRKFEVETSDWRELLFRELFWRTRGPEEPVPEDYDETIEALLGMLSENESLAIQMQFRDHMSLMEIADELGYSTEYSRLLVLKGLRKLRSPACKQLMILGLARTEQVRSQVMERVEQERKAFRMRLADPVLTGRPVSDLPVRGWARRALEEKGFHTVGEVAEFVASGNQLSGLPGFGTAIERDIHLALRQMGLLYPTPAEEDLFQV